MSENIINFELPDGDKTSMRTSLINLFLNETAGCGTGENASRYRYNVEYYNNYIIFLKRPTRLNKGFDFTVNIQGLYFKKQRTYKNPSHEDIFYALNYCRTHYPNEYAKVSSAIIDLYNCKSPDLSNIQAYFVDYEGNNHPIQIILLAIKWLFMEQDCAYWNYSGRYRDNPRFCVK